MAPPPSLAGGTHERTNPRRRRMLKPEDIIVGTMTPAEIEAMKQSVSEAVRAAIGGDILAGPCVRCANCSHCRGTGIVPELKYCANENCRKPFRFQDGTAVKGQFKTRGVIYCCQKCSRAQGQRDRRRAARENRNG